MCSISQKPKNVILSFKGVTKLKKIIQIIYGGITIAGTYISTFLGGYDETLKTLFFCIGIDIICGWVVAIFRKSKKTNSGGLSSRVNFEGLIKKVLIIVCVSLGQRFDLLLNVDYIRTAICIAFIINETLSIIENLSLMGVKMPDIITKVLDILKGDYNNASN